MQQYLNLLKEIKENGTWKSPAREGMPSTLSLFGHQMRFKMSDGFPLVTTKKVWFKGIVVELLWFLRGDSNIKYLVDNGVNIWNEDAYNYYCKIYQQRVNDKKQYDDELLTFEGFIDCVKHRRECALDMLKPSDYEWGDMGHTYGKLWRGWHTLYAKELVNNEDGMYMIDVEITRDQIKSLIEGIRKNPEGRRHIVTAIDPAHSGELDVALNPCHAFFQINCRKLTLTEQVSLYYKSGRKNLMDLTKEETDLLPKYYLDCHMYQRSADVVLGVPFNIASYALLLEIISKLCNMIPGDFVHSFGDVHIYEDHMWAVDLQLTRKPHKLPKLEIGLPTFKRDGSQSLNNVSIDEFIELVDKVGIMEWFDLTNYISHPKIDVKLSTGLK